MKVSKVRILPGLLRAGLWAMLGVMPGFAGGASAADSAAEQQLARKLDGVLDEMKRVCPLADPGDQAAADRCRQALFRNSRFREMLAPIVLWGRQRDPNLALKQTHLTQFAPDVLTGLYVPLFMFNGEYRISYDEREKLYLAKLGVAFRNRLHPGQFPYPFWHEADKWNTYENANTMLLWIDPKDLKVRLAQFSARGEPIAGYPREKAVLPAFDGKWLWTDAQGRTQPAVTLFDGLFHADNPHKARIEQSYRAFAVALREGQCFSCHVPDNPDKMKKLVLLQTPAHAAAEIKRVLKDVRENRMPLDELGIEKPLDPPAAKMLLEKGEEFAQAVEAAREWERVRHTAAQ